MGFNTNRFEETQFQDRVFEVPVPALSHFFDKDEKPIWKVRGVTGQELAKVNDAISLNRNLEALLSGITSEVRAEKIEAIKEAIGISEAVPDDLVRRIALLKHGSVDPVVSQEMAVKFADTYPTTFYLLTNRILAATGDGKSVGELSASGEIEA